MSPCLPSPTAATMFTFDVVDEGSLMKIPDNLRSRHRSSAKPRRRPLRVLYPSLPAHRPSRSHPNPARRLAVFVAIIMLAQILFAEEELLPDMGTKQSENEITVVEHSTMDDILPADWSARLDRVDHHWMAPE